MNGYTSGVVESISKGKELKVLLLDGNHLANVIYGQYAFQVAIARLLPGQLRQPLLQIIVRSPGAIATTAPRDRQQPAYANPVTQVFVEERLGVLEQNASFRRIDLHWCLTIEPSQAKAFERKPQENTAHTSRLLSELQKTAALLAGNLSASMGLELLSKQEAFRFLSYLFNLEDWVDAGVLRGDAGVDRQIVQSPVSWERDYLRIGKRFVQMYSLKTTPETSRPCLFSDLLTLDCDSILCSTWRPKSSVTARHEIDQQEKFISFFKVGVLSRVMAGKDSASLDTGAGAKAANNAVDDLSDVIRALDKKAQGEFSLRLLIAARSQGELHSVAPSVHRVFVEARAQIMEETLGNLSAFYAMFPGNGKFNVFPMWLGEDHHARLSSIYAPNLGHAHSEDLDAEYLNIFETRTRTPFFQDVYVGDGVTSREEWVDGLGRPQVQRGADRSQSWKDSRFCCAASQAKRPCTRSGRGVLRR